MKIIIFLVLAGLSLAQDEINCPKPPTPKNKEECFILALQAGANFTKSLRTFICYYKGTFDENIENHDKASRDYLTTMACSGCAADEWIGTNKTFEDLYRDIGKVVSATLVLADRTIDELGLNEAMLALACKLAGDALASQCLDHILKKNIPEILYALNDLFCKGNTSKLTTDQMIDLMDNVACFANDALHNKVALKLFLKGLGEDLRPALTGALDTIKNGLAGTDLVKVLGCKVTKSVLGEKPLVDAGSLLNG